LITHLREAFRVTSDAEVAIELDPRALDEAFVQALQQAGVNRASLGVQTFDPAVQAKVNRIQPFEHVAWATRALRAAGVHGLNFDLMYGLPGQTAANVEASAELAADLRPDRISVFGYAHVPWFKKHQKMIDEAELEGLEGRWAQAEAADRALVAAGYERVGLDHYALPDDPLARAARGGALHRNFQGYTTDACEVLVPLGASSIGRFPQGYVQNAKATDDWAAAIGAGRLSVDRGVEITPEDRLRARAIERLMCDLELDAAEVCQAEGFPADALDASLACAAELAADGLCRVQERIVTVPEAARRLVRTVAACFDGRLQAAEGRHSKAV
jgi:oxygen-independent coproporphyrinogen-3 oxidase